METTPRQDDSRATRFGVDGTGVTTDALPGRPRIVVGLDGSEASLDALRRAVRVRTVFEADITAVVAWHYPAFYDAMTLSSWSPERDAEQILSDAVTAVFRGESPPRFTGVLVEGNPTEVLTAESEGAEMVVVGSRGRGGFSGLLAGSVSMACVQHAHCPVLVVRSE